MNKTTSQKIHAVKRYKERYGVRLSNQVYSELIALVQSGAATTIIKQSNRVSIRQIEYKSKEYFFVYDRRRKTIVTFLTKEMVTETEVKKQENIFELKQGQTLISPLGQCELISWDTVNKIATVELKNKQIEHYKFSALKPLLQQEESSFVEFQENQIIKNTSRGIGTIITKAKGRNKFLVKFEDTNKALWIKEKEISLFNA
jgi:hypothetical protein